MVSGEPLNCVEVLLEILSTRKLIGSSTRKGFICGKRTAVCFQDAPLYSVAQNIYYEYEISKGSRYTPVGIAFPKDYLFRKGARPVIYDVTNDAKRFLPEEEWWRIVHLDLSDPQRIVDWTHEREWRLPGDLEFDLDEATVLVGHPNAYHYLISKLLEREREDILTSIAGVVTLRTLFY